MSLSPVEWYNGGQLMCVDLTRNRCGVNDGLRIESSIDLIFHGQLPSSSTPL